MLAPFSVLIEGVNDFGYAITRTSFPELQALLVPEFVVSPCLRKEEALGRQQTGKHAGRKVEERLP